MANNLLKYLGSGVLVAAAALGTQGCLNGHGTRPEETRPSVQARAELRNEQRYASRAENLRYFKENEQNIYSTFGGKENLYNILGWKNNRVLTDEDKADLANWMEGTNPRHLGNFQMTAPEKNTKATTTPAQDKSRF